MDEKELKSILKKHRTRGTWLFIVSAIVFLSIHHFYENSEAIATLSYTLGIIIVGMAVLFTFVEKVLLEVLITLSNREKVE